MASLVWPANLLTPNTVSVQPKTQSRSGGKSYTGTEQVTVSPAFTWGIKLSNIFVRSKDQTLLWRTIEGRLDGRAGTIMVPALDWSRSPGGKAAPVPFAEGLPFSDGSLFRSYASDISLAAPAALNATSIRVQWRSPAPPQAGQFFSLGQRLYKVIGADVTGDRAATLTIRPWLREAWDAGTRLEFDEPACLCRLEADDAMNLDLEVWKFGSPSVSFVEAFP